MDFTSHWILIEVVLMASALVKEGGYRGTLLVTVPFCKWNLADVLPNLLSLFEYTAAILNLNTRNNYQMYTNKICEKLEKYQTWY